MRGDYARARHICCGDSALPLTAHGYGLECEKGITCSTAVDGRRPIMVASTDNHGTTADDDDHRQSGSRLLH